LRPITLPAFALAAILFAPGMVSPGLAQSPSARLDSRLREARTQSRAGDHARALPLVDSLYAELPTFPNVVLLRGAALARAGRDAEALAMLRRLLAWNPRYAQVLLNDSSFARLRDQARDLDIPARAAQPEAVVSGAGVIGVIEERDLVPEGTAWNPRTRTVLVGSMYKNTVVAIGPDGGVRDLVARGSHGLASVAGIHVDSARGILWVASNARFDIDTDTTSSALYAFDAGTGAFRARHAASAGRHFLNDMTTTPDGTVYLTDTRAGMVWRLRPGGELEPFEAAGPLISPNGITSSGDGRHLFVADLDHIRVIPPGGEGWWRLAVPDSIDVSGIDGLAYADGSLIAHQWGRAGRISRYLLDDSHRGMTGAILLEANTADVRTSPTGEVAGTDYVFIGNSQIDRMNARTVDAATMEPVRIYRTPLRPPPGR
jgi:hypothetical protein